MTAEENRIFFRLKRTLIQDRYMFIKTLSRVSVRSLPPGSFTSLFSSISYHQHVTTWNFTTTNKWTPSNEHQSSFCSTAIYHHRFDPVSKRVLLELSPWHKWVPCYSSHNFSRSQLTGISQYSPPSGSAVCPLGAMQSITRGHTLLRRTSHLYRETVWRPLWKPKLCLHLLWIIYIMYKKCLNIYLPCGQ